MNDATELEPSLAGAIDFFQNLHRKMGALETDTYARHNQFQSISTTLAALEQDRQSDRQTLVTLARDLSAQESRLTKLQTDSRALDKQLTTVETLVARFQEEQQEVREALTALSSDLRQELQSILTQQAEPAERMSALETRLASQTREQLSLLGALQTLEKGAGALQARMTALESRIEQHQEQFGPLEKADRHQQQHLEEFSAIVEAQHKRLLQLEITLENLDQGAQSTTQLLNALKTDLKRHDQALASLDRAAEASETAKRQLQDQQSRLDELSESSSAARKEIASLKTRFEDQRQGLAEAARIRQEVQKQQERVKHLETLVGKVSADTNSTRQILNVLQTDLTTQNDTLRELDQSWRDSLSSHHDRLNQLESAFSSPTAKAEVFAAPAEPADNAPAPATLQTERFEALEQALAETRAQYEGLQAPLDTLRQTLTTQGETLNETQELAWSQIQNLQERLSEAEATLDSLHAAPAAEPAADAETQTALNSLRQELTAQAETLAETQELAWSQIQNLQERLSEAEATLDSLHAAPAAEPAADAETETALSNLRQELTTQAETLAETQELAWSQIQNLQERLSEAEATLDSLPAAPATESVSGAETEAALNKLRQDLSAQTAALNELRDATRQQFIAINDALEIRQQESREIAGQVGQLQTVALEQLQQAGQAQIQQIQALQHRLDAAEATLDLIRQPPESGAGVDLEEALAPLRQELLAQTGALDKLRDAAQQQLADLATALQTRQQESLEATGQLNALQQEIQKIQQQPATDATAVEQRLETVEVYSRKFQEDLESIQETVTALESRLSSQSQAYSGNFEQFRALNSEIHALHQKIAQMEAPQLGDIDQELAAYQQDIAQLREAVEQIQADSQQMGEMIQPGGAESPVADITARLDEQQERLNALAMTVETVRADAKATQETVVTMATNVAKRIHEIQNLLVATETTQGERLQEVEQKLIWLQAALETMESQKPKPRRWFSMPASLTSVLLTVGAAGVAILAEMAWMID